MGSQTLVNVVLLASLAVLVAALLFAAVLYVRRRAPKTGTGRRSAVVFGLGTIGSGIAVGYLSFLYLPWPLCVAFDRFSDGSWCALTPYVAGPFGFTMGALTFAGVWSLMGLRPNTTPHADARDVPPSANAVGARAGGRER